RARPVALLGAPMAGVTAEAARTTEAHSALLHVRRRKDADEVALLRRTVAATARGFAKIAEILQPGLTERDLQVELEAEFFRGGGARPGYGTIVGSGPNSAVLHFEPSARTVQPSEFVLIDAGAEIDRYTADVTRTFIAGEPSAFQRDLYLLVLAAEERAIERCVPGREWKDIHLGTAMELTAGLVDM